MIMVVTTFNSRNTGTSGMPDMYTQSLRAIRLKDGHIRQTTSDYVTTIM